MHDSDFGSEEWKEPGSVKRPRQLLFSRPSFLSIGAKTTTTTMLPPFFKLFSAASALFLLGSAVASSVHQAPNWPFDVTTISSPDGSVTAKFVSVGATLTELWVKDRHGKARDVVLGYDDNLRSTQLLSDPNHPLFNPIVGRYANRIKNGESLPPFIPALAPCSTSPIIIGSFSIPITKDQQPPGPNVYQLPLNDYFGKNTIHGGVVGWDRRNWTVVVKSPTSVTYKHVDAGDEGFPGNVTVFATHSVSNGVLKTSVHATATEKTPIMTTQHIYWNLDAFQTNNTNVLSHHLQISSSKVLQTDEYGVPTGGFIDANQTPAFDFRRAHAIDEYWNASADCGTPCQGYGYDNCWIYDRAVDKKAGTILYSSLSGIKLEITTNQPATQIYTAYGLNVPRKLVHGGPSLNYTTFSAVAIEQEGWLDAVNTPEFGVDQIYEPGREFEWKTEYRFSVV